MASVSVVERPSSTLAAEDGDSPLEILPSECSSSDATVHTTVDPPSTAVTPDTAKKTSHLMASRPIQHSVPISEDPNGLEDRKIIEHDRPTTPELGEGDTRSRPVTMTLSDKIEREVANPNTAQDDTTAQRDFVSAEELGLLVATPETTTTSKDAALIDSFQDCRASTADNHNHELRCGELPLVEESSVSSEPKERENEIRDNVHTEEVHVDITKKKETSCDSDEEASKGDTDTAVEVQMQVNIPSVIPRSVPPHMRPFKTTNPQEGRRDWPLPAPRAPRSFYPSTNYQPARPLLDYDEHQRTKAQLMKARNDLEIERKVNDEMRKTIGAEKQASISAAMSAMLTDLLQKQADALAAKAKSQEKEHNLQYREQMIAQIEEYLSEGQKQLKFQLEQQGIRTMSVIEETNLRREAEIKVRHQFSDIEGKIAIQAERLRYQEAAEKIREQQYKVLIRDAVENETRKEIAEEMHGTNTDTEAVEAAYNRGCADAKQVGGAQISDAVLKQEFVKGYATCYRSQTALYNLRNGSVAADSPELAFLYDPTHSENPHNMGLSIGRMDVAFGELRRSTGGATVSRMSMQEGTARAAATTRESQTSSNTVTHRDHSQVQFEDVDPTPSSPDMTASHRSQQAGPVLSQKLQKEESTRSAILPRSTFAGELRGSSAAARHGGIFSNRVARNDFRASAIPVTNGVAKGRMADRIGEGVYAGRRTIRYEDDPDIEPASPNLIDLY